jgi:hypothetical protein
MSETGISRRTSYCRSYSIQTCVGESFPRMTNPRTRTVLFSGPKKCTATASRGDGWSLVDLDSTRNRQLTGRYSAPLSRHSGIPAAIGLPGLPADCPDEAA